MSFKDWLITAGVLIAIGLSSWSLISKPKIGFVRMDYVLENYKGTKEASEILYEQSKGLQEGVDSLRLLYLAKLKSFKEDSLKLSSSQKRSSKEDLAMIQYKIQMFTNSAQESFKTGDEKLSLGIINQVNTYLTKYAEENRYDYLLRADLAGGILFGKEGYDVTEQVLKELNESYKGSDLKKEGDTNESK